MVWFILVLRMGEHLIKNADASGCVALHQDNLPRVFAPAGWGAEPAHGWGHYRIRIGDAEVSFSDEGPGWQVVIEGTVPAPGEEALVRALADQICEATGQDVEVVPL